MAKILGLFAYYHDSAACLLVDGDIVAAAQEERFTRKKHDWRFPAHAAAYCLKSMARKRKPEGRQARESGVVLAVMVLLAAAGFYSIGHHSTRAYITVGVAGVSLALTFLAFPLWLAFFRRRMVFAEFMGMVMSTVILTIFFYLLFTPIVLVVRLFGNRMLDLSWHDERASY